PVIDGRLEALDAETGKPVWEARVAYPQDNYTVTMAPRIAKGKVIIGVSGAEFPVRGFFAAYDANTGQFAWRFYTIPGDPSKPFENPALKKAAETWSGEWWKLGGGGTVWDGMAYDPEADLIYVGTGNGGPWPGQRRQFRGKDNLFVCSILAVKPDTGELKWYYQPVPGDSWDYDSVQGFILTDLTINGRQRKVLMQANKDGFYYVLDRITGAFISVQPFALVTCASGIGLGLGVEPPPQTLPTLPPPAPIGPVPPGGQRGMLVAWDPVAQRMRWRTPGGGSIGGGTVTTAGNLVFQVIPDGRFVAYTADKGEKLLEIQSGLRRGVGPPITYMLDGQK